MLEVEGLLHSAVRLDGPVLEFFHHGQSTARLDVRTVKRIAWEDQPAGGVILQVYAPRSAGFGPMTVIGFGPEHRQAADALRDAIEAALRAGGP